MEYDFGDSWDLIQVQASRQVLGMPISIQLSFSKSSNEVKCLELLECRDYGILESLLDAERIVVKKLQGTQAEFGSIKVECFGESYAEYFCDEANEII
ncbi:hypothetical protein OFY17_13055 [Marinomonas sp. C2222]|uniref:Uncharacterized protein n=1 Tax=Marinomonas sargassi TaxID=2984494 RepID=A0ABT2YV69_9GAMM|nr:hypothetical protein [Marinomonas sargassi]MCV2403795.1 hypothetical protein [Marinomonas sargassi]